MKHTMSQSSKLLAFFGFCALVTIILAWGFRNTSKTPHSNSAPTGVYRVIRGPYSGATLNMYSAGTYKQTGRIVVQALGNKGRWEIWGDSSINFTSETGYSTGGHPFSMRYGTIEVFIDDPDGGGVVFCFVE
jgi:hypothetical protein